MRNLKTMQAGPHNISKQSGFALIVGLVVLLLLTLIMLTALKLASLEERMAGNLRNQNIAFQAAESALREAEALISSSATAIDLNGDGTNEANPFNPMNLYAGPFQQTTTPVCVNGLCQRSEPVCVSGNCTWPAAPSAAIRDLMDTAAVRTADLEISGIPEPQYVIELLPIDWSTDERRRFMTFRITAIARGGANSLVQLQSTYRAHMLSFVE
ncbi:MAG: PilX N-terminal domain-containing pilus assembly protein [Xanthomonadales bacterium]|nr:PilX N-terminal domain-containing pilus assembly protein [Xanthomonadales bacterium]